MKIGDKVSFLSESGGGIVAGFQGKNIVLVEDEDGFQIPTPINDVVVVAQDDYSTSRIVMKNDEQWRMAANAPGHEGKSVKALMREGLDDEATDDIDDDPADKEITYRRPEEERKGGNQLSAYVAFVPMDIKNLSSTRFEVYFVNDSNYYLRYTLLSAEGANWTLRKEGEAEPNTKEFLDEVGFEDLESLSRTCVQMLAYKRGKAFILKPVVETQFRVDPLRFYKLHAFRQNDFFETPSLIFPIIENDVPPRPLAVDPNRLKQEMYKASSDTPTVQATHAGGARRQLVSRYPDDQSKGNRKHSPYIQHKGDNDAVVVDLHIDQLLDSTDGMDNAAILDYQLKVFRDTLASYAGKKGQKIIFIHGKGEGVLRRAIINDLHYRYKTYTYQDASFQEYGYGATQVTIK